MATIPQETPALAQRSETQPAALALSVSLTGKALALIPCDEGRIAPLAVAFRPSHESILQNTSHAEPVLGDPFQPYQALPCTCLEKLSFSQYTPVIFLITLHGDGSGLQLLAEKY